MQTLARLFGRSPFAPLRAHMTKVASCVHQLPSLFKALEGHDHEKVEAIASLISKFEHEADLAKNDIRNHLPSNIFLPIPRAAFLELLSFQDSLADCAEDIGVLLTLKALTFPKELGDLFKAFVNKNIEAVEGIFTIINEMDRLLESSFGGSEANKVMHMVDQVALKEHESDVQQRSLLKAFFSLSGSMDSPSFFLWMRVIEEISSLSDYSEKLANRVRMLLEVK